MRISALVPAFLVLAACSKPPSSPPETKSPDPATESGAQSDDDDGGSEPAAGLTAAACEAQGGKVIGDIGDGAIHQPDYRCPESGEVPLGPIIATPDGPVGVEGSVCCE